MIGVSPVPLCVGFKREGETEKDRMTVTRLGLALYALFT